MLDSIYHMTLKLIKSHIFRRENIKILRSFMQCYKGHHFVTLIICKPQVVYLFYCMALYHSQTQRHVINGFQFCLQACRLMTTQHLSKHIFS